METQSLLIVQSEDEFRKQVQKELELSIKYEGCKAANRELVKENDHLKTIVAIMGGYIIEQLEMFESLFDADEEFCDVERMKEYVIIARYMETRYSRQSLADRVQSKINALPW